MCNQRQLSNDELTVLFSVHAGISPAQYEAITEVEFIITEDEEIHLVDWSQDDRLKFLLLAARTYGRPN